MQRTAEQAIPGGKDGPEVQRVEDFKKHTEDKLRGIRCPRHGQAPRVKFHGRSLREITISMSGCCDQLIGLANRAIAQAPKTV